jgi:hypothetical protein
VLVPDRERLMRRRAREQERERRRQAKRQLEAGAKELGHAVEEGVAALLHVAAERIAERAEASRPAGSRKVRVDSAGRSAEAPPSEAFEAPAAEEQRKARG